MNSGKKKITTTVIAGTLALSVPVVTHVSVDAANTESSDFVVNENSTLINDASLEETGVIEEEVLSIDDENEFNEQAQNDYVSVSFINYVEETVQSASVNYDDMIDAQTLTDAQKELNALNSEKDRLEQEVKALQNRIDISTNKYNAAKAEYEKLTSSTTVDELNAQISKKEEEREVALKNLQEAQAELDKVNGPYNSAMRNATETENAVKNQQNKIDDLTSKLAAKTTDVENAQAALNEAKANYELAQDVDKKVELEAKESEYQTQLTSLQTEQASYQKALESEEAALTPLLETQKQANAGLESAKKNKEDAQKQCDILNEEISKLNESISSLQNDKTTYEGYVETAKTNYEKSQEELENLAYGDSDARKLYNSTKAAYDAVFAQWNQGSLGFFKQNNDTQAQTIIGEGETLGSTTVGNYAEEDGKRVTYDATYLENMKICVDLLGELNRLRKLEGLSELKVSDTMMAIGQVKANASAAMSTFGHTGYYNTYENLTKGYTYNASGTWPDTGEKIEGVGPYIAWYGVEKRNYEDALVATNDDGSLKYPGLASLSLSGIYSTYKDLYNKVGHYLVIKTKDLTVQGLGFNKLRGLYDDPTEGNYFPVNGVFALQLHNDHKKVVYSPYDSTKYYDQMSNALTVDEYVSKFYSYYNDLKSRLSTTKEAYDKAKVALDSTISAEQQAVIDKKQQEVNRLKAKLDEYQTQLNSIKEKLSTAQNRLPIAKTELEVAQSNVSYYGESIKTKEQSKTSADDAVSKQQTKVKAAEDALATAKGKTETCQNNLDLVKKKLNVYNQDIKNLETTYEDARLALTKAQGDQDYLSSAKERAEEDLPALEENLKSAKEKLEEAEILYNEKHVPWEKAVFTYEDLNNQINQLTKTKNSITSNKQTMELALAEISMYKYDIAEDNKQIAVLNDKIAKAQKNVSELTETIEMHRLYNMNSGEHFYTSSTSEKNHLVSLGWKYEGIGWNAPKTSNYPVYRLYNGNGGEHHYTMSASEKNMLVNVGWSYEGIGWYSADPNSSNSIPLLREYNPNAFANNHNYTTSNAEHSWLISLGWKDEGKAWYAINK